MVQEGSDASVVTARILREMRNAEKRAEQERIEAANRPAVPYLEARPRTQDVAGVGTMVEVQSTRHEQTSIDPDAYYRRGRMGVVAVIALILFWVWLQQRRSASTGVS